MLILHPKLKLYICGVHEVGAFKNKGINVVLTFSNLGTQDVADYSQFEDKNLQINYFNFHDIWPEGDFPDGLTYPKEADVARIIQIGRDIKKRIDAGEHVNVLCQCHAGISRSTAAAYILLNTIIGEGKEVDISWYIKQIRYIARPNPYMVYMADRQLKRNWKMILPMRNAREFAAEYSANKDKNG